MRALAERHPPIGPVAGALGDRVADQHLIVAVGERGVRRPFGGVTGDDVGVDGPEQRPERVGEPLDVPTRQCRRGLAGRSHERRVAEHDLVRLLAMAEPQVVGRLRVPGGR